MNANSNVLLAFDFGRRRIGIASGNALTGTASPVTTLSFKRELPWTELDRIVGDWQPGTLVLGLPQDSGDTSIVEAVRAFGQALEQRYELPVALVDETLSSQAARSQIREGRRSGYLRRRVGKGQLDRHAACLIAEQWLSNR